MTWQKADYLMRDTLRPDLYRYRQGTVVAPYTLCFESNIPGPTVAITALIHGNEYAGAVALDRLAKALDGVSMGRLYLCFAHHEAYGQYDPERPLASRYLQRDMNRVWDDDLAQNGDASWEAGRARELLPIIEECDFLLDLHTMVRPGPPLAIIGPAARHRDLAMAMGMPDWLVIDPGHASGRRLTDYRRFRDDNQYASAILLECGGHQETSSIKAAEHACWRFLNALHLADLPKGMAPEEPTTAQQLVRTTHTLTPSDSTPFSFSRPFQGLELLPEGGTLVAMDGEREIRTPYENCVLLMPSILPHPDDTALRFGRIEPLGGAG